MGTAARDSACCRTRNPTAKPALKVGNPCRGEPAPGSDIRHRRLLGCWPGFRCCWLSQEATKEPGGVSGFTQALTAKRQAASGGVAVVMEVNVALRVGRGKAGVKEKTARVAKGLGLLLIASTPCISSSGLGQHGLHVPTSRNSSGKNVTQIYDDFTLNGLTSYAHDRRTPVGRRSRHRHAISGSIKLRGSAHPGQCALEVDHIIPRTLAHAIAGKRDTDRHRLSRDFLAATSTGRRPEAGCLLENELALLHFADWPTGAVMGPAW